MNKKKVMSLLLSASIAMSSLSMGGLSAYAAEEAAGGDTEVAAVQEETVEEQSQEGSVPEEEVPEESANEEDTSEASSNEDVVVESDNQSDDSAQLSETEYDEIGTGEEDLQDEIQEESDSDNIDPEAEAVPGKAVKVVANSSASASNEVDSGNCGENVSWRIIDSDGEYSLIISGSGPMAAGSFDESPWEDYKEDIVSVDIGEGVTEIGDYAFISFSSMTEISIPESVTRIGEYAFAWCSSLESIYIPQNVTVINDYTFMYCRSLNTVNIPNNVTEIGSGAFNECAIESITIPNSVVRIGGCAFDSCSELKNVNIPNGVKTIEAATFAYCDLREITIPDSVTNIEREAFRGCNNLTSITLSQSIEKIEYSAFENCPLSRIDLPVTLRTLGSSAINNSDTVIYYAGTEKAWGKIIQYADSLDYKEILFGEQEVPWLNVTSGACGENAKWSLTGDEYNLTLTISGSGDMENYSYNTKPLWEDRKSEICNIVIEEGITSIGDYAFSGCEKVKSVDIPGSIKTIGGCAFTGCGLTDLNIPNGVEKIKYWAFNSCKALTAAWIPNSVTSIGEKAFADCTELTSLRIPGSLKLYEDEFLCSKCKKLTEVQIEGEMSKGLRGGLKYSFRDTPWWKSFGDMVIIDHVFISYEGDDATVTIPDDVTEIEREAFYYNSIPESIIIPDSVKQIGTAAFAGCSSLKEIKIPEGITVIEGSLFADCRSLVSIKLPSGLTEIEDSAFSDCNSLKKIVIPDGVTSIGDYTFSYCKSIDEITIPDGIPEISEFMFSGCSALRSVTIPKSVTRIGESAFAGCGTLTSIEIPSNVKTIDYSAFEYCTSLTRIVIPDGVSRINNETFRGCTNLVELVIPESVTKIDDYAFYQFGDDRRNIVIYGVKGSYAEEYCEWRDDMEFHALDEIPDVKIVTQPKDAGAAIGDKVSFHVEVQGKEPSYQWQWSSDGESWNNCTASSSKTDTFSFTMKNTYVGRRYRCVITFSKGKLITMPAYLKLKEAGKITLQPENITLKAGETAYFHVKASGEEVSYQWQYSLNGSYWGNCTGAGNNTDTFGFVMQKKFAGRQYRCVVTSDGEKLISDAATVSLKASAQITEQPENSYVKAGERASFHVAAEGSKVSYQWQYSLNGSYWSNCSGAGYNTDTFGFVMQEKYAGRQYRCIVTADGEKLTSDAATANLKETAGITGQPEDAAVKAGDTATFHVEFSGKDPVYQWQYSLNGTYWSNCKGNSYNMDTFSFVMQEKFAGRQYRCVIKAGGETYTSDSATVSLAEEKLITESPADVTVKVGKTASFHVETSASGVTYQWQWSSDGKTWKNCTGAGYNTDTFSFATQTRFSGRSYRCMVTDGAKTEYSDGGLLTVTK